MPLLWFRIARLWLGSHVLPCLECIPMLLQGTKYNREHDAMVLPETEWKNEIKIYCLCAPSSSHSIPKLFL